jgi:hypothetical protein
MDEVEETKKQVKFSARDQSIIPPSMHPDREMVEVEEIERTLLELHVSAACFLASV